jgi:hypothetical protein
LNRRDFHGSTPYSDDELAIIQDGNNPKALKQFRADRGHEIGRFIYNIIEKEHLPHVKHKATEIEGGVVLMGWSLGNSFGFAMLAHMRSMHPEMAVVLQEYVHTYIAFGEEAS